MVDVTVILKSNLEEGFNAKNVTSIRMKFDLSNTTRSDVYSSFMTKATTKIEVDNYNLFTLQKIDDKYTFANNVYLKVIIFSLRNYEKGEEKKEKLDSNIVQSIEQTNLKDFINKKREKTTKPPMFKVTKAPIFKTYKQVKIKKPLFKTFKQSKPELPLNEEEELFVFDDNNQYLQYLYRVRDDINGKIGELKSRYDYVYGEGNEILKNIKELEKELENLKNDFGRTRGRGRQWSSL